MIIIIINIIKIGFFVREDSLGFLSLPPPP